MSNVVLIHPPVSFDQVIAGGYDNIPPLGLLYIAAFLEEENITVKVIDDLDASLSIEDILKVIGQETPKLIGISSTTSQIKSTVEIAKKIKEKYQNKISIGIGGCHISADSTLIKRYPYFDFGVVGEGEIAFKDIAKKIISGKKVKGVIYGEPVKNLDLLPFPSYHLVDLEKYKKKGMAEYPILGTRGCPMKCIFCSRPGMSGFGREIRSRSPVNIIKEIESVSKKFQGRFNFQDDSFTVNRENAIGFCQEVIKRKLKIKWCAGGVRIDKIDEELVDLMYQAGCTGFCFGIESGSERVRNLIVRKGIWDNQIIKTLKICSKYPLDIQLSLVIGFPTETLEEMIETVMFGKRMIDLGINCLEFIAIMLAVPLPGAELFNQAIKEGKVAPDITDKYIQGNLGEGFRDNWPVYIPEGITLSQMNELRKKGYKAFYFSPYYIKRRIRKDFCSFALLKKDLEEALSIIKSARSRASFS